MTRSGSLRREGGHEKGADAVPCALVTRSDVRAPNSTVTLPAALLQGSIGVEHEQVDAAVA